MDNTQAVEDKENGQRGLLAVARFEDEGLMGHLQGLRTRRLCGPVARFEGEGPYGPVARFEGRPGFFRKAATRLVQEKKSVSSQ